MARNSLCEGAMCLKLNLILASIQSGKTPQEFIGLCEVYRSCTAHSKPPRTLTRVRSLPVPLGEAIPLLSPCTVFHQSPQGAKGKADVCVLPPWLEEILSSLCPYSDLPFLIKYEWPSLGQEWALLEACKEGLPSSWKLLVSHNTCSWIFQPSGHQPVTVCLIALVYAAIKFLLFNLSLVLEVVFTVLDEWKTELCLCRGPNFVQLSGDNTMTTE